MDDNSDTEISTAGRQRKTQICTPSLTHTLLGKHLLAYKAEGVRLSVLSFRVGVQSPLGTLLNASPQACPPLVTCLAIHHHPALVMALLRPGVLITTLKQPQARVLTLLTCGYLLLSTEISSQNPNLVKDV
jgi:hypothetical protein